MFISLTIHRGVGALFQAWRYWEIPWQTFIESDVDIYIFHSRGAFIQTLDFIVATHEWPSTVVIWRPAACPVSPFFQFFFISLPSLANVKGSRGKRVALTGWFGLAVVILFKSADMCRYLDIKIWSLVPALLWLSPGTGLADGDSSLPWPHQLARHQSTAILSSASGPGAGAGLMLCSPSPHCAENQTC